MDALADILDLFSNNDVNPGRGSGSGGVSSLQDSIPTIMTFINKYHLSRTESSTLTRRFVTAVH